MRRSIFVLLFILLLPIASVYGQAPARRTHIELGLGLLLSPEYEDVIVDTYSDAEASGYLGWIELELGLAFYLTPNVQLIPQGNLLFSSITFENTLNLPSSRFANVVILPGIEARYALSKKSPSLYASLAAHLVSAHSDLSRLTFASGGIALGGALGLALANYQIEVNFRRVPVEVFSGSPIVRTADFGGFGIIFRRLF